MEKTVYFRSFEEEDAEYIFKWMNDDELKELSVGLNRRMCREEALEWVKARMRYQEYNVFWAICSVTENKIIGYMSLNTIHYINRSANFGGLVIGDKKYQDGTAWIEAYIFILDYAFERLNLNRLYGTYIDGHPATKAMADAVFFISEGVLRQSVFKNGKYNDEIIASLLAQDYFEHKRNGEYRYNSILKRLIHNIKIK